LLYACDCAGKCWNCRTTLPPRPFWSRTTRQKRQCLPTKFWCSKTGESCNPGRRRECFGAQAARPWHEHAATGLAASADSVAVGGGAVLFVAGPALAIGTRLGWSVAPSQVRLTDGGRYSGVIEGVTRIASGHLISIRFGDALLDAAAGFVVPSAA